VIVCMTACDMVCRPISVHGILSSPMALRKWPVSTINPSGILLFSCPIIRLAGVLDLKRPGR